ncbi:MAG: 50S ribosomal protein L28 [Candidatus Babeliales bacterium]
MARICKVCDKRPQGGNLVSHANNRTKRWIFPNVHKIRFTIAKDASNEVHRGAVCTKCVKAGKVQKVL